MRNGVPDMDVMASSVPCPFDRIAGALVAELAAEQVEVARFAYCDASGRLLGARRSQSGTVDAVEIHLRRIAIDALALDAALVVAAHNHPHGDAWPSRADRDTTRRLAQALSPLGVRLYDHVVVGRGGTCWSFRAAGLL